MNFLKVLTWLIDRSGTSMSRNLPEISPANNPDIGTDDTDLDNESFQSELDQESTHSSLVQQMQLRQYQSLRQISLQQQQVSNMRMSRFVKVT